MLAPSSYTRCGQATINDSWAVLGMGDPSITGAFFCLLSGIPASLGL